MSSDYPSLSGGGTRRAVWLALAALVVAVPAALLVALCPGDICGRDEDASPRVPFCSLPPELRRSLVAGYREGRSPDVFVVGGETPIRGSSLLSDGDGPAWPSVSGGSRAAMGFWGTGVASGADIGGASLDDVAPTIERLAGITRTHPEVRSGKALPAAAPGDVPRLVLLVVWEDVAADELESLGPRWDGRLGAGTFTASGRPGSAPSDPGALMATIGTGGLPHQHGTTGSLLRGESGKVVRAWGSGSPPSVIAALGDDLDEVTAQRARIGLVGTQRSDIGLIGGDWYVEHDSDDVRLVGPGADPRTLTAAAASLLASGYGRDDVPDLLAVAMQGEDVGTLDGTTASIVQAAEDASGGSLAVAFTAIGTAAPAGALDAGEITTSLERALDAEVVAAEAVGGLFLDQDALVAADISEDDVVDALRKMEELRGGDVFTSTAIELARYC